MSSARRCSQRSPKTSTAAPWKAESQSPTGTPAGGWRTSLAPAPRTPGADPGVGCAGPAAGLGGGLGPRRGRLGRRRAGSRAGSAGSAFVAGAGEAAGGGRRALAGAAPGPPAGPDRDDLRVCASDMGLSLRLWSDRRRGAEAGRATRPKSASRSAVEAAGTRAPPHPPRVETPPEGQEPECSAVKPSPPACLQRRPESNPGRTGAPGP